VRLLVGAPIVYIVSKTHDFRFVSSIITYRKYYICLTYTHVCVCVYIYIYGDICKRFNNNVEAVENNWCFEVHVIHHSHLLGKGDIAGQKLCRWSVLRYWMVTVLSTQSGKLRSLSIRQIILSAYVYYGVCWLFSFRSIYVYM
jgi:hypothetical protein